MGNDVVKYGLFLKSIKEKLEAEDWEAVNSDLASINLGEIEPKVLVSVIKMTENYAENLYLRGEFVRQSEHVLNQRLGEVITRNVLG